MFSHLAIFCFLLGVYPAYPLSTLPQPPNPPISQIPNPKSQIPNPYIPFTQLSQKYNLSHEKDYLTGREIFSGNGYKIIAASGMSTILINEKLTVLGERLQLVNGELALSAKDFSKVERILVSPYDRKDKTGKHKGLIKKVVLDPGHGGPFRGCKAKSGLTEKEINLDIAFRLRTLLEQEGIIVVLTRTTDRSLSANLNEDLTRRFEIANREQPDLFISLHCNWSNDPTVRGFEIYYSPENTALPTLTANSLGQKKPDDKQTQQALTHLLKDEYKIRTIEISQELRKHFNKLPTEDRGLKRANFRVTKYTEIPSILIEMDFLSNKTSAKNLSDKSYRQQIVERIRDAIVSYGQ
ncbi:MAG: N-acetylmuramoyl-L-alanine amidase [Planctomycetota bacterium]|nr:N-acetylmuramoyl-L-alanine amidase [Planctomycetota bacterium]